MRKREEQELAVTLMELDDASDAAHELHIPDLMAALEASLARAKGRQGTHGEDDEEERARQIPLEHVTHELERHLAQVLDEPHTELDAVVSAAAVSELLADWRRTAERLVAQIAEARTRLEAQLAPQAGVPVPVAAKYLGVSPPTVRSWIRRGVLDTVEDDQVDRDGLRQVGRAISELRARGQDRNFLASLVDYADDRAARQSDAVKRGLDEMARGELEPA